MLLLLQSQKWRQRRAAAAVSYPDFELSEAGSAEVLGHYQQTGLSLSRPLYTLNAPGDAIVWWYFIEWLITNAAGSIIYYRSEDDVPTPGEVTTWVAQGDDVGEEPMPVITLV